MNNEIWKDIKGYEGAYQASNFGRVRSLDRVSFSGVDIKGRVLKDGVDKLGYKRVVLSKSGKTKTFMSHRLVALTFIDNPNSYPCINHKDENPSNNNLENLEWCTHSYNSLYNGLNERIAKANRKPVYAIKDGFDYFFNSSREAAKELNLNKSHISNCLNGRKEEHNGYKFEFAKKEIS